jgi:hypothetical protein
MKFAQSLIVAAVLAVPAVSFAQSSHVTREEVRAQLVQLEQSGYNPASDQTQYPKNIEAANARIYGGNELAKTSLGPAAGATSMSGSRADGHEIVGLGSVYAHP